MKRLLPKSLLATLMLILYAVAASAEELRIDFENDLTYYAEWDFVNIGRQEEEGIAHGGRSYGTNNKNTSYITTKSAIANPQNITFFISKRNKATTTTASFWYLQVSADGNSWENVQTVSATAMAIGEWKEITQDLTAFENVYIRIHYNGANSVRPIDDILLTTSAHEKKTAKPSLTPSDIYTSPTDITITNNEPGATVYYTTDGTIPTKESQHFTGASKTIRITATTTVMSRAIVGDKDMSAVASATYTRRYIYASLEELIAEDVPEGSEVTVSFENAEIKDFRGGVKRRTGIFLNIQKDDKDIEISYRYFPQSWVVGGNVSGTIKCQWKKYTDYTWQLAPPQGTWDLNSLTYTEPATTLPLTIGSTEYATYYNSKDAFIMPEDCEGYIALVSDGRFSLTKAYASGSVVPAGEAVVIKGVAGEKQLSIQKITHTKRIDNSLLGTDEETALDVDDDSYFYALSMNNNGDPGSVGFYWRKGNGASFTNGAHKAYLKLPKTTNAKTAYPFSEYETTGIGDIDNISTNTGNGMLYNIIGQRTAKPLRGQIYIVNGRKHIKSN